jgi:2-phospho-L-lactate guanylyltransferase (CobY/MobA/RfbA family)
VEYDYLVYTSVGITVCADIDDMTDYANAFLHEGEKEIRLVIRESQVEQ